MENSNPVYCVRFENLVTGRVRYLSCYCGKTNIMWVDDINDAFGYVRKPVADMMVSVIHDHVQAINRSYGTELVAGFTTVIRE